MLGQHLGRPSGPRTCAAPCPPSAHTGARRRKVGRPKRRQPTRSRAHTPLTARSIVATRLRDERRDSAARYLGCGLIMAACMGMLGASVLVGASDRLVAATGLRDAALLRLSAEYLRIRALALPAVLLTMVAQSGARRHGQRDHLRAAPSNRTARLWFIGSRAVVGCVAQASWRSRTASRRASAS